MDAVHGEGEPAMDIAGFWRRLGALAIDCVLLGVVGFVVGQLLFDPLARMGAYARLLGFAIALAYFGICNSRLRDGQTLAKQWLGLRVVDANGQLLSPSRSLLRYIVLGVPFFANGLPVDPSLAMSSLVGYLLALVVFGGIFAIVYLYIFNRRTRQSLHDLVVGSYVVRVQPDERAAPLRPVWRGHLVVVALLAALALAAPAVAEHFAKSPLFADLLPMQKALSAQPHVMRAQVTRGWSSGTDGKSQYLSARLLLDAPKTDDADLAKSAATSMAEIDPDIAANDAVVVNLVYGFDMVIASGWKAQGYSFKPAELE